jgi:diguanylate cyclase (GGDEF)-like protein/PAS domain S-box-containing protein
MKTRDAHFPEETLSEFQGIVDLVVRLAGVRVALIMRLVDDDIEVAVCSDSENNPYHVGDREHLLGSGLYCEAVVSSQKNLLVANALKSERWNQNPDLKYGLISYLGFPIRLPDGKPLGTICLLDDKENPYSPDLVALMEKMRDLIEAQLSLKEENRLQRLFAKASLVRQVLDNIPMAVACCNLDDDPAALYCNEQFVRSFGYTVADVPTIDRWYDLVCPDEQQRAVRYKSYQAILEQARRQPGKVERREFSILCKDGRTADVLGGSVVIDKLLLLSMVDISERKRSENELKQARDELAAANAELKRLAITDSLTGISNRRHFEEEVTLEMARAQRYAQPLSLLLLDIDHFKAINDQYGHLTGDRVLIELSQRIGSRLRSMDRLARWGGEEFVVLMPYCDAAAAVLVAEDLRKLCAEQPFPEVGTIRASFGVAELKPGEKTEEWFKRVDVALYEAKSGGRDAVRLAE